MIDSEDDFMASEFYYNGEECDLFSTARRTLAAVQTCGNPTMFEEVADKTYELLKTQATEKQLNQLAHMADPSFLLMASKILMPDASLETVKLLSALATMGFNSMMLRAKAEMAPATGPVTKPF